MTGVQGAGLELLNVKEGRADGQRGRAVHPRGPGGADQGVPAHVEHVVGSEVGNTDAKGNSQEYLPAPPRR